MDFHLKYGLCCIKHCWGVYEQNSIVNSVRVDDWTAELAIIGSNEIGVSLLAMIALLAVQSSVQTFIDNAILFFNTSNNA